MREQSAENLPSTFDDGELYDLVADGIPYGMDFYIELAKRAQGPVLDIACGTGRILLPCLMAGIDMEGLDLFEPMHDTLKTCVVGFGQVGLAEMAQRTHILSRMVRCAR